MCAGAGPWAIAAVESRLPYFGLVLTEVHMAELLKHIEIQVEKLQRTPGGNVAAKAATTPSKITDDKNNVKAAEKKKAVNKVADGKKKPVKSPESSPVDSDVE